jgi:hypothetical protein
MKQFDVIIIGSGPAGQKAAIQATKLGRRVAVIKRENAADRPLWFIKTRKDQTMSKHRAFPRRPWRLLSLTVGLAASAALAQGPPDLAGIKEAFQKQQANEQALRQYSWKSRTEVQVDGKVKGTLLELVRYGADGNLQKTPIGGQTAREKKLREFTPAGALIGRIKRKKQEEYNADLRKLLDAYANIPPDRMQRFFQNAAFQPGQDAVQGAVRIFGSNVVSDHDTLSLWIDPKVREKRQLEILTSLDDDPVQLMSQFRRLPDGTLYTSLTTVEIRAKKLKMVTENFDFARSTSP